MTTKIQPVPLVYSSVRGVALLCVLLTTPLVLILCENIWKKVPLIDEWMEVNKKKKMVWLMNGWKWLAL